MNEAEAFKNFFEEEHGIDARMEEKCRKYWQAALEWRDSPAGEAAYIVGLGWQRDEMPERGTILYEAPPAAQINEQMREALELTETEMRYANWGTPVHDNLGRFEAYKAVLTALAATPK